MEIEEFDAKEITECITAIVASVAVSEIVGEILDKVAILSATNIKKSDVAGDSEMHPTKKTTALSKNEATGSKVDSALADDDVNATSGSIDGVQTGAKVSTAETTAAEAGVTASRAKAGAADIETKAMKIM